MQYEGKRTRLSRITQDDLDFISELECNPNIWLFEEYIESDRNAVKKKYLEKLESKNSFDFVISKTGPGEYTPVGIAQIWSYVRHRRSWEIGFAILPEHQGNGHGQEAVELLVDFAFNYLQAHKVVGMCNCKNIKSMKLMERLGMRREGIFKEELFWQDQWYDQYFYSLLDSEYI